jgi:hypothetical protein
MQKNAQKDEQMMPEGNVASVIDAYARDGLLIVRKGGTLPRRCIRCNAACDSSPIKITLINRPMRNGALIGGLLGGAIGGALGAMADTGKGGGLRANFEAYVCPTHLPNKARVNRNIAIILGLSLIAGFVAYYYFRQVEGGFLVSYSIGIVGLLIVLGYAKVQQKGAGLGLALKDVESGYAIVRGPGRPFLDSLPKK